MTIRTVDVALSQLGVREATGKNDGIPADLYSRGDKVMWCASFILWCNAQSQDQRLAPTDKLYFAMRSVKAFEAEMKSRGWWLPPGSILENNDINFYDWSESDVGVTGRHVDITVRLEGSKLHTVGGNQGNAVTEVVRNPKSRQITGHARIPV